VCRSHAESLASMFMQMHASEASQFKMTNPTQYNAKMEPHADDDDGEMKLSKSVLPCPLGHRTCPVRHKDVGE
jgi:hypothetical protein